MDKLTRQTPLAGLLPVTATSTTLSEHAPAFITSIAPYSGNENDLSAALKTTHGLGLPQNGRSLQKPSLRILWTGRGQFFLVGAKPAAKTLAKLAALSDQSDGWAVMHLIGKDAGAVMARVCPLDLRASTFKGGDTARSEVAHMMAVLSKIPKGFEIMVMRSFAATAVHHIHDAMVSVAAQNAD